MAEAQEGETSRLNSGNQKKGEGGDPERFSLMSPAPSPLSGIIGAERTPGGTSAAAAKVEWKSHLLAAIAKAAFD